MEYKIIIATLLGFIFFNTPAQEIENGEIDSLAEVQVDSIQERRVAEITRLLVAADSVRKADSLARERLIDQINELKTTDNLKKQDLINRLDSIERVDSIRKAEKVKRIDSLKAMTAGYPVQPFTDTLFSVYNKLGPFSARDRAGNITSKIRLLSGKDGLEDLDFDIVEHQETTDLEVDDTIILSITDEDAIWMGMSRQELAELYQAKIIDALSDFYESNQLKLIMYRAAGVILVFLTLFFLIFYINNIFSYFKKTLYKQKGNYIKGVKIKNYEFLTAHRLIQLYFTLLDILKVVIVILALYIALPVLFSIFPWTQDLADRLFNYILQPLNQVLKGVIAYIPKLFTIAVIYFIIHYLLKFIRFLAREIEKGELVISGFYPDWAKPIYNIVRFLMYGFMFVVIFPYLPGSESPIFKGVIVFFGLLILLGSMSAVSNLVAGLAIIFMRPYKIGDRVKIGEVSGDVIEKTLLVTRLKTIKNEEVTIPNASILSGPTINYSSVSNEAGLIIHTTVTISYEVPWPKVHELLIEAAKKTNGIMKEKNPFVLQMSLDDFYVRYQINLYSNQVRKMSFTLSELHQNIQDCFQKENIEIMSRHYPPRRDGGEPTTPSSP